VKTELYNSLFRALNAVGMEPVRLFCQFKYVITFLNLKTRKVIFLNVTYEAVTVTNKNMLTKSNYKPLILNSCLQNTKLTSFCIR